MTNGGTGPFRGNLLLVNSGRGNLPPSITAVNPAAPHNVTVLLDNFIGRQFNSLNDIKIHPTSKKLFFTDVTCVSLQVSVELSSLTVHNSYGWLNHFRPLPLMPSQVYRFDPDTGSVRVVADGFDRPNGIAFTKDGKTAYMYARLQFLITLSHRHPSLSADTGASGGFLGNNQTEPATMCALISSPQLTKCTDQFQSI